MIKKQFRAKFKASMKMAKQSENSKGRVQKLLQAAIEEEVKQFMEMNEEQLLAVSPKF